MNARLLRGGSSGGTGGYGCQYFWLDSGEVGKLRQKGLLRPLGQHGVEWLLAAAVCKWLKEGRIDVKPLISKIIALEEVIDFLEKPKDPSLLKVQIKL